MESSTRNPESLTWNPESKTALDSLTWGENYFTTVIFIYFLLILGCDLILGHAVDKDLLLLIQYEVRDLVKGCNAIRSQMTEHHERLGALEEKEAAAENRSKEVEKVLEKLLSFKAQNERIGKLSL